MMCKPIVISEEYQHIGRRWLLSGPGSPGILQSYKLSLLSVADRKRWYEAYESAHWAHVEMLAAEGDEDARWVLDRKREREGKDS